MAKSAKKLRAYLTNHGLSYTNVRQQTFNALDNKEPQTMSELIAALPYIDRSSVYRTISLFERIGVVHRIQMGWKHKFELSDEFNHHHHHMTCINCHRIIAITDAGKIEKALEATAKDLGFKPKTHQIEVQGLCKACAKVFNK